jgi:hypothetical protein
LRRPVGDGIEVGGVQLSQAERAQIGPCELHRIAVNRDSGDRPHRLIAVAPSGPRVHRATGQQIEDAKHSHL